MFDDLFVTVIASLRTFPTSFISFLVYILCASTVILILKYFKYSGLCCYLTVSCIIANIQVLYPVKYEFIPFATLLGTVIFSSTFLVTDIINKNYGVQHAKRAILLSVIFNIFFVINMILMLGHKYLADPEQEGNVTALYKVFVPQVRLLVASYVSFLCSQLTEILLIRNSKTGILRHNFFLFISSVFMDNLVFTFVAFVLLGNGSYTTQTAIEISLSALMVRVICNLLNTYVYKFVMKHYARLGKDIL